MRWDTCSCQCAVKQFFFYPIFYLFCEILLGSCLVEHFVVINIFVFHEFFSFHKPILTLDRFLLNTLWAFILYMSGNSQGVKKPYLGHKIILCNTLLWAPGPILMAPDSFYIYIVWKNGDPNRGTKNSKYMLVFASPVKAANTPKSILGLLAALTGEANTSEYLLYLVPLFRSSFSETVY